MSEKKYVVPEGMYLAAMEHQDSRIQCGAALEAALRWLSENPIVPTDKQIAEVCKLWDDNRMTPEGDSNYTRFVSVELQRRMFLAPEPEVPEELQDLIFEAAEKVSPPARTNINERILEAFRRGLKACK